MKKCLILTALALMMMGGRPVLASHTDTDLYVNDEATIGNGSSCDAPDFNTISAAISHANAGDTVRVCPGAYPEQLIINGRLPFAVGSEAMSQSCF